MIKRKPKSEFIIKVLNIHNTPYFLLSFYAFNTTYMVDFNLRQLAYKHNNMVYISLIKVITDDI